VRQRLQQGWERAVQQADCPLGRDGIAAMFETATWMVELPAVCPVRSGVGLVPIHFIALLSQQRGL